MNYKDSIEQTKQGFEESFRVGAYYNKQTRDDTHLELILRCIQVEPGMKILDLGTGSGYLAFPFADKYKQAEVVGLDIVEDCNKAEDGLRTTPCSQNSRNALAIDELLEYARFALDGEMQAWVDAIDSLEVW